VQHAQEESPAQNSLPPQDARPDAHTQTSQAAQDPQDAKTQEPAQKSAEDSSAESAHAAQSTPWGSQTSNPQPAEGQSEARLLAVQGSSFNFDLVISRITSK